MENNKLLKSNKLKPKLLMDEGIKDSNKKLIEGDSDVVKYLESKLQKRELLAEKGVLAEIEHDEVKKIAKK